MLKKISMLMVALLSFGLHAMEYKDIPIKMIKGEDQKLSNFAGKTVVVVNIATKCGLTGQLDDLEALYQKYKDDGLMIVGIPSNDFMGQTPEGNEEVAEFCRLKYGVTFPLAEKMVVKGDDKSDLYKGLIANSDRPKDEIGWNFEKFVLDKSGKVVARYSPRTQPMDSELEAKIQQLVK